MLRNSFFIPKKNLQDLYEIGSLLGSGTFSFVHIGINKKTKERVAIKITNKCDISSKQRERIQQELEILSNIKHPNIVNLLDFFESENRIVLILELKIGGELFDRMMERGRFSEEYTRYILRQIGSAVAYLHRKNIVHRDLKPENMLFDDRTGLSRICLADFGFAKIVSEGESLNTPCGTPAYVAPEIVNSESYKKTVDMWSLGVVMYTLLSGFPPFYSEDDQCLLDMIAEGNFTFPKQAWENISEEARDLVSRLLEKDPSKRCTAEQFLEHQWTQATSGNQPFDIENNHLPKHLTVALERVPKKEEIKHALNRAVAVQREGTFLRSASESTLWKRRQDTKHSQVSSLETKGDRKLLLQQENNSQLSKPEKDTNNAILPTTTSSSTTTSASDVSNASNDNDSSFHLTRSADS